MHPVTTTLSRIFGVPPEQISDSMRFRSADRWDSLADVELVVNLESSLGETIDMEDVAGLDSVADLRSYFDAQLGVLRSTPPTDASLLAPALPRVTHTAPPEPETPAGALGALESVVLDQTRISEVDLARGQLSYRGYPIEELAGRATFEEVAHLLIHGWLPDPSELRAFRSRLGEARELPAPVISNIVQNAGSSTSAVLRTAVSALAVAGETGNDPAGHLPVAERLIARVPTIFATQQAARTGRSIPRPNPELSHAESLLHLLGLPRDSERVHLVELCLVLQAENGCNASALAARVAANSGTDTFAAITVALSTFSGAHDGGAAQQWVQQAQEIEDPAASAAYLRGRADQEGADRPRSVQAPVEDPRVRPLREAAQRFRATNGGGHILQVLDFIRAATGPYRLPNRDHDITVDCYAAAIHHMLGLPSDLFFPMFTAARLPGWLAHIDEQRSHRRPLPPLLRYVGPRNLHFTPRT